MENQRDCAYDARLTILPPRTEVKTTTFTKLLPFSFTIENLESVLEEKYEILKLTQNARLKKSCDIDEYTITVDVKGQETSEEIKEYLFRYFKQNPRGGSRNYQSRDKPIDLFLHYENEHGKFNIRFSDISALDLRAAVEKIYDQPR